MKLKYLHADNGLSIKMSNFATQNDLQTYEKRYK